MEKIIEAMFRVKAVEINTENLFTWASGMQSPIYCDQRLLLSDVEGRQIVIDQFIEKIKRDGLDDVDAFVGTATSGIPWASFLAMHFKKPLLYVRSSAKGHGQKRFIEGKYQEGMRVVVLEDLISTGGSVLQVCNHLASKSIQVEKVYANFSYGLEASKRAFSKFGIDYTALVTIDDMLGYAKEKGKMEEEAIQKVSAFIKEQ